MIEIKSSSVWHSVTSPIVPTQNLTATEEKQLAQRNAIIDRIKSGVLGPGFIKVNSGINKGSIVPAENSDGKTWHQLQSVWSFHIHVDAPSAPWAREAIRKMTKKSPEKGWTIAQHVTFRCATGDKPINLNGGSIFGEFMGADVHKSMSILLDYEDGPVFCLDEKKRPLTFTDRLEQEVSIGDIVVVALNYGAGLDICAVKGFADERRVVIESMETGELDRIPLEDNETQKIMKMPNSLRDTALMLKLSRN